jgi:phage-related minor tail protein
VRFGIEGASEIISRRAEELVEILDKAENQAGKTNDVARQLGFTFESAFEDAILRGRKLSEVLQGIATDIARIFIRRTITEPIGNWFSGLLGGIFGSAKGNVFDRNDLVPFARGGVVDRPTIFPFARGIGLMGEAGPEAIMPLARDSQGRLGVRASGASPVINQTINVNVSGGGVSDMVEQQRLAREIGRLTRAGVIDAIQEQQRAGGLLRPSPQMV